MRGSANTWERARRGDQEAFALVVSEQQSLVFSLALHFLHDRGAAEELAQEVFLTLYRKRVDIKSERHLKNWLRKVTSHRCIDYARRTPRNIYRLEDICEPHGSSEFPDPLLERQLRRLVATLPPKPRMVIVLRFQEDLDPAEIAEIIDMPLNTVKSHLRRALAMLRDKLAALSEKSRYETYGR